MENLRSFHQHLFKENVGKIKKKIKNVLRFEKKDLGVVYAQEGVSTPHARHEDDNF